MSEWRLMPFSRLSKTKLHDSFSKAVPAFTHGCHRNQFANKHCYRVNWNRPSALLHLIRLENPPDWINVGTSEDISILDFAKLVAKTVSFKGRIETDISKPDGTSRKLTDTTLLQTTGWSPSIDLANGLRSTYAEFLASSSSML